VAEAHAAATLALGETTFDISARAVIMGILNRTPDSFYDRGATFELDILLARAESLAEEGADLLDVGGVKAGPGPDVSEAEELDRVVGTIAALHARLDVPLSVDTWRASVAREAYREGAVMGNDISGFADPEYLDAAARAGASVVATHIRLAPRVRDPDPVYGDVVETVSEFLLARARSALDAGIPAERVVVDAGFDLGKTPAQSLELLRATDRLSSLGYPLLVSASNKTFLGAILGLDLDHRGDASLAAAAMGIGLGGRVLRVHDVEGTRRVRDAMAAVLSAEPAPEDGRH
jgi:dihydropteroate synthase